MYLLPTIAGYYKIKLRAPWIRCRIGNLRDESHLSNFQIFMSHNLRSYVCTHMCSIVNGPIVKQRLQKNNDCKKKKMKKIMISPFFKISRNENIIITTRLVNDFEHVRLQWNPLNAQLSELRNFLYSFMGLYVERQHEYVCRSSNNLL